MSVAGAWRNASDVVAAANDWASVAGAIRRMRKRTGLDPYQSANARSYAEDAQRKAAYAKRTNPARYHCAFGARRLLLIVHDHFPGCQHECMCIEHIVGTATSIRHSSDELGNAHKTIGHARAYGGSSSTPVLNWAPSALWSDVRNVGPGVVLCRDIGLHSECSARRTLQRAALQSCLTVRAARRCRETSFRLVGQNS